MKITIFEIEKDIDEKIIEDIADYYDKFGRRPTTIIISKPLMDWLKKTLISKSSYSDSWRHELNCDIKTFDGLNIIETLKQNVIEVF